MNKAFDSLMHFICLKVNVYQLHLLVHMTSYRFHQNPSCGFSGFLVESPTSNTFWVSELSRTYSAGTINLILPLPSVTDMSDTCIDMFQPLKLTFVLLLGCWQETFLNKSKGGKMSRQGGEHVSLHVKCTVRGALLLQLHMYSCVILVIDQSQNC